MQDDFDGWIDRLQEEIDQETRAIYSEKVFKRWKNPTHVERMETSDAWARIQGSCGDTMEVYLNVAAELVIRASAFTDGCGASMVCGSIVAKMAEGKTLEEALDIRGEDVVAALDGLPEEDLHCAFLAAQALHEALHAYLVDAAAGRVAQGTDAEFEPAGGSEIGSDHVDASGSARLSHRPGRRI